MGRSSPLVDVCKHMPRSAEPRIRGYASAESQAVRNATCGSHGSGFNMLAEYPQHMSARWTRRQVCETWVTKMAGP